MSREPYAYEMLFRSEDMHGASFEGNGEITRDKAKAEADGRAMVEVFGYDEWALLELYAEPPEVGELEAALREIAEDYTPQAIHCPACETGGNREHYADCPYEIARSALARYEDKGGTG